MVRRNTRPLAPAQPSSHVQGQDQSNLGGQGGGNADDKKKDEKVSDLL